MRRKKIPSRPACNRNVYYAVKKSQNAFKYMNEFLDSHNSTECKAGKNSERCVEKRERCLKSMFIELATADNTDAISLIEAQSKKRN